MVKWKSNKDTDPLALETELAAVLNESRSKKQEKFAEITGNQTLPFGIRTEHEHLHKGLLRDLHTLNIDKKKRMDEEMRKNVLSC